MSKHSPGPWEVGRVTAAHGAEVTAGRNFVADVFGIDNARLIAAAPELLEALKALTDEIKDCAQPSDWESWAACQAAIAKAEGAE